MSDLVPAAHTAPASPLAVLADPAGGNALNRLRTLTAQPAVRRALPWFGGMAAIGALALTYAVLSPAPQRMLYGQLDDAQRADVVAALDKAAIPYKIDNSTGSLTVNEEDLYRARMVVASDGALATPESGIALLDSMPLGASRTMEGERLRTARERELMMTIKEIDGVEAVRVHLAEPEQSVFVRESTPPSASVMLRLARGRQLSDAQVTAIANLVANSVSGLPVDNVRIVDQHGRLLSQNAGQKASALELQARIEEKLRTQVNQLLTPVLGADNFTSEIQVELDMEERTAARESYDKQGVVRQETEESSRTAAAGGAAIGVPGAMSNTPPLPATPEQGGPQGSVTPAGAPTAAPTATAAAPLGETRASRSYELGREVSVSNSNPGGIKRMSVAVALSAEAMKKSKASDIDKIKALVSAAVGANPSRGDQVEVMVRSFADTPMEEPAFYETGWFASLVRYGATLIGVLLVLLLGVRPILRALRREPGSAERTMGSPLLDGGKPESSAAHTPESVPDAIDRSLLNRQVGAAQKFVEERPDRAVVAIRQMLNQQAGT
jgi:flagellar M-ring protein FliF